MIRIDVKLAMNENGLVWIELPDGTGIYNIEGTKLHESIIEYVKSAANREMEKPQPELTPS